MYLPIVVLYTDCEFSFIFPTLRGFALSLNIQTLIKKGRLQYKNEEDYFLKDFRQFYYTLLLLSLQIDVLKYLI